MAIGRSDAKLIGTVAPLLTREGGGVGPQPIPLRCVLTAPLACVPCGVVSVLAGAQ